MQIIKGVVEDFKAFGPSKGQYGEYYNHSYTVGGQRFSKFSPTAEPLVQIGQTVTFVYQQNKSKDGSKTYNNIDSLVLEDTDSEQTTADDTVTETVAATPVKTTKTTHKSTPTTTKTTQVPAQTVLINTPSKDVSMEVSGLAQALINSGVPLDKLENQLVEALLIKRSVARRVEAGELDAPFNSTTGRSNGSDRLVQSQE